MEQPLPGDLVTHHAKLLAAVARKDRQAFVTLFAFYAPRVKAMMMRGGLPAQRAEDLAQDTMLTVWRKADLYNAAAGSPSAWIFTIARNRRIDVARGAARAPRESSDVEVEQVDDQPLPDAMLECAQSEVRIRNALTRLSPEQRTVVQLSFFDSRSHSEIAEELGIPLGTVKSRMRLAFQHLRTLLEDLK